jgi:manganese/zinc/iron transport system permease protein
VTWTYLDTWIVVAGALSAASCALLGNFLVLRRMSMMGDAISHAVLPGLAVAFLVTLSRDSVVMFAGAAAVGLVTALLTQLVHQYGRVESQAAMGVVFTTLFALGLILIVRAADSVDLDPGCVLYGAIELIPLDTTRFLGAQVPRAVLTLAVVFVLDLGFVVVLYKELNLSSFDPGLATTLGINARRMHYLLMGMVAITTVAAFESVGSILVIAMLIVPAATAGLMTRRLPAMIGASLVIAVLSAGLGHLAAITVPTWFGFADTNTAGSMAVVAGLLLVVAIVVAPGQGVIARTINTLRVNLRVAYDDLLGAAYRADERGQAGVAAARPPGGPRAAVRSVVAVRGSGLSQRVAGVLARRRIVGRGLAVREGDVLSLTPEGRRRAAELVRTHRLWEDFLHEKGGVGPAEVHFAAEQLEHVTSPDMALGLAEGRTGERHVHGPALPGAERKGPGA